MQYARFGIWHKKKGNQRLPYHHSAAAFTSNGDGTGVDTAVVQLPLKLHSMERKESVVLLFLPLPLPKSHTLPESVLPASPLAQKKKGVGLWRCCWPAAKEHGCMRQAQRPADDCQKNKNSRTPRLPQKPTWGKQPDRTGDDRFIMVSSRAEDDPPSHLICRHGERHTAGCTNIQTVIPLTKPA